MPVAPSFARLRRTPITILGSLVTAAILAFLLAGHRDDFAAALSGATAWVLVGTVLLQIVALLARSEAWHLTIREAGGTVARRALYRASSMGVLGGLVNAQVAVAARIAALRRSSPDVSPQVPTLIAAEFPILAVEAALAALTSFTLVGPLGLPWWLPLICLSVVAAASAGLRRLALRKGLELWRGLAIVRSLSSGSRLVGFVLVAVFAQIFRNWLLLHAVGVDASFFDAIAVLIAVVALAQLPVGPSVGAAAAVLILGSDGVAAAAAAGVLLTATGTVGGLCFAGWAGADRLWSVRRRGFWVIRSQPPRPQHYGPGHLGLSVRSSASQPQPPVGVDTRHRRSEMAVQASSEGAKRDPPWTRQRFVAAVARLDNGTPVVSVTGDVDLATAPALEQRLLDVTEAGTGEVIVDLTGCSFLDHGGLSALIATKGRLKRSDRSIAIVLSNPSVMRIFQITHVDEQFEIYPSLRAAGHRNGHG